MTRNQIDVLKSIKNILVTITVLSLCLIPTMMVEAKPLSLVQWDGGGEDVLGNPHSSRDTAVFYISDGNTLYKYTISGLQGKKYYGEVESDEVVKQEELSYSCQLVSTGTPTFEAPSVKSISLYPTATNAWIEDYGYYDSNGIWVSEYWQSHPEYKEWGSQTELKFHYGVSIELDTSKTKVSTFKGAYKYETYKNGIREDALCYNHSYDTDGNYWYWSSNTEKFGVVTDKQECLKVTAGASFNKLKKFILKTSRHQVGGSDEHDEIPGIGRIANVSSLNTDSVTISGELQTFSGTEWVFNNNYIAQETDEIIFIFDIQPSTYTLTVNPNGGTWNQSSAQQTFPMGIGSTKNIPNPIRTGYTFAGWTVSGAGSSLSGTMFTMGQADTTLTATWKINSYTLTVNPNGGIWNQSSAQQTFSINYGSTRNISDPIRTGYTFTGWTLSGAGSSLNGTAFTMGYADATLTATWRIHTSILRVNPNGGTWNGSANVQSFTQNYHTTKEIPVPTRRGYTFTEWMKSNPFYGTMSSFTANAIYTFGAADAVTSTITASWRANNYTLTLDHNKGNYNGSNQNFYTVTYDTSNYSDISDKLPVRTGYTFNGYWTDKDGGTQVYTKDGKSINDNIHWKNGCWYKDGDAILYAHWIANTYTLKFHPNEGSIVTPLNDMKITYDTTITLPNGGLYYAKYTINGENVTADVLAGNIMPAGYDTEAEMFSEEPLSEEEIQIAENERYAAEKMIRTDEIKAYPSVFRGWLLENERSSLTPRWKPEKVSVNTIVEAAGIVDRNNSTLTLYAVWDDCPWIVAEDLYYTLEEAQSGFITHEELISHAKAFDRENNNHIAPGKENEDGTSFYIWDYTTTDFTDFKHSGSVTETYRAVDSIGNEYKKRIVVNIVDTESDYKQPLGTTRFITEEYYNAEYENGGLEDNSVWKTESEYIAVIREAFNRSKNKSPEIAFYFPYETILQMKDFVEKNGIGNSKSDDALQRFYNQFMKSNTVP